MEDTPKDATDTPAAPASPGPDVRPTDVPSLREDYPFVAGELTGLSPREGWFGVIAIVPVDLEKVRVALFVKASTHGGAAWLPPRGTMIMDVPRGFSIEDGDAILSWIKRGSAVHGKPPPIGPVVD